MMKQPRHQENKMKIENIIAKTHLKRALLTLSWLTAIILWISTPCISGDIIILPENPMVETGGSISISVSSNSGDVLWSAMKGTISGSGPTVVYYAPDSAGFDIITVLSGSDVKTVKVTITTGDLLMGNFAKENSNWEIYTNRRSKQAMLYSESGDILWVGTTGGLEERDAESGRLIRLLTTLEGLPDNGILSLMRGNDGGIWIGTVNGGLVFLDSESKVKTYNLKNSGLPDNTVTSLLSDGKGGLYAGTLRGGLAHMSSAGKWDVYSKKKSELPVNEVLTLHEDGKGGVWVGTENGGLAHLSSEETWEVFDRMNSNLPDDNVSAIADDGNGGLWVGTYDGLARFMSDGSWQVYKTTNSNLPHDIVSELLSDGAGGVWVGTGSIWNDAGGLVHISNNDVWEVFTTENSYLPDNRIRSLIPDEKGGILAGTGNGIARLLSAGTWEIYDDHNSGLASDGILALISDGNGGVYAGTRGGIAYLSPAGEWNIHDTDNSTLPDDYVCALSSDGSGGVYAGTSKGLAYLSKEGEMQIFTSRNSSLPDDLINVLAADGDGGVWVGTESGGLSHLKNDGSWRSYNKRNSDLPDNGVFSLLPDGSGGIYAGTQKGGLAHLLSDGSWKIYNDKNTGLSKNSINALLSDNQGGVWIGTYGAGLVRLSSDGSLSSMTTSNSKLSGDKILSLLPDNSGGIWIGLYDKGLVHLFTDGTMETYDKSDSGLPDNDVSAMLDAGIDGLWIGTRWGGLAHLTFGSKQRIAESVDDDEVAEEILTGARAAVLVHPRGSSSGYRQEVSIEFMAAYAYRTLQSRGYDNNEIYFLSYKPGMDINGDGLADVNAVDGPVTAAEMTNGMDSRDITIENIESAFDWAKKQGTLEQPFLFIFVDHGLSGGLRLDPFDGVLSATALKAMLDDYQNTTGNKTVVLIEACHSGTLVKDLAGPDRVIITSTGEDKAYYEDLGMLSFSKLIFDQLRRGESFFDGFTYVSEDLPTYGHPFDKQPPQLDDDGDGSANSSRDGKLAKTICLNGCFGGLAGEISLEPVTKTQTVTKSQKITLAVKAGITEGGIKDVWALVTTPEAKAGYDDNGYSLVRSPQVFLKKQESGVWSETYSDFTVKGDYTVVFMAKDQDDFIAASTPVTLTLVEGEEANDDSSGNDTGDCEEAPKGPAFKNPATADQIAASHIHANVTHNAIMGKDMPSFIVDVSCYASPVDIYLVDWYEDGSMQFVNESGVLTSDYAPFKRDVTKAVSESVVFDAPLGVHVIYWMITPANGGDFWSAFGSNNYELGWHGYDIN